MTTQLVQIRCNALRSKSSYGAFGDFHEEMVELWARQRPIGA